MIDLRSDTVTRPTPAMRKVMAEAEVGDDVFNECPSTRRLEEQVADLLGKEAALFVPSGTMSNQLAVKTHCVPGDEILCDLNCHVYQYEGGAPAVLAGVTCRTLDGENGILELKQLEDKIRPNDIHQVVTRMVTLENTHNRGGGKIYPLEKIAAISQWARSHGLIMHLDGARLWNAIVATGVSAREWSKHFDTVSVCFSKGLGAPVGSALLGSRDFITRARRFRKMYGGGMRQCGILAAAASFALENHVQRLADDHRNAQILADALREVPGVTLTPNRVETNLVWANVDPQRGTAKDIAQALQRRGILVYAAGQRLRACTHLDVGKSQIEQVADTIRKLARE